jgi:hypothetical protein
MMMLMWMWMSMKPPSVMTQRTSWVVFAVAPRVLAAVACIVVDESEFVHQW